ncbi:GFA family protein [Sulfitobacter albidus]|uniref:GFA family protein n=1 Tax=Sulfitobacter albidus TaxID=2829501 RepID=A0A975PM64_9RHOB|nr:GFA family protein [Sulfitobacter albidus]QUJ76101.1 GFA family protein [Sulfitobacter albidus]
MSEQIDGRCLCGAVEITLSAPAGWVGACHCSMCRRWSGTVFAGFPAAAETVRVTGQVRTYASSEFAERAFCETCGSHLWVRDRAEGADYDLMPGLFAAARDWPLKSEIYLDEAPAWLRIAGDHKTATREAYLAKNPQFREVRDG